jgi:hypothetical protein
MLSNPPRRPLTQHLSSHTLHLPTSETENGKAPLVMPSFYTGKTKYDSLVISLEPILVLPMIFSSRCSRMQSPRFPNYAPSRLRLTSIERKLVKHLPTLNTVSWSFLLPNSMMDNLPRHHQSISPVLARYMNTTLLTMTLIMNHTISTATYTISLRSTKLLLSAILVSRNPNGIASVPFPKRRLSGTAFLPNPRRSSWNPDSADLLHHAKQTSTRSALLITFSLDFTTKIMAMTVTIRRQLIHDPTLPTTTPDPSSWHT